MANLTVKKIPAPVYRELKEAAARQGRSLNSHVIGLLVDSAEESARRRRMRETRDASRRFVDTLPPMSDSTAIIREARDTR